MIASISYASIGKKYGSLIVQSLFRGKSGVKAICKCECGDIHIAYLNNIKRGFTKSCGCKRLKLRTKHNNHRRGKRTSEYIAWDHMIQFSYNKNSQGYNFVGAKNIGVYKLWRMSFAKFLKDVGRRPARAYVFVRKDVSKDFSPDNCEWRPRFRIINSRFGKIFCHSSWEVARIKFLSKCKHVLKIIKEPARISYTLEGIPHKYLPDFKIIYDDGSIWIEEIKPNYFLNLKKDKLKNIAKLEVVKKFCLRKGYSFKLLSTLDIVNSWLPKKFR